MTHGPLDQPTNKLPRQAVSSSKEEDHAERSPVNGGYLPCYPKYWAIHGEYYDLSSFVERHPGGEEMLLVGKGRDCTELFESVHALSQLNLKALLAKYKVERSVWSALPNCPPPPPDQFTWESNGFYSVLTQKVKRHFAEKAQLTQSQQAQKQQQQNGGTATSSRAYVEGYKAGTPYWIKVSCLLLLWATMITYTLSTGCWWTAAAAGFLMNMVGFCVMHDGSHFAISRRVWVNRLCHTLWNNWNLWSHFLWLRHHVYGHHSYTGVFRQDPDLVNASSVVRKHHRNRKRFTHTTQTFHSWFIYTCFPNQHVGQSLLYLRSWFLRHIFGVPIHAGMPWKDWGVALSIYIPSIYFHFVLPMQLLPTTNQALAVIVSYWTAQGIGYFVNICPNHDTFDTHEQLARSDAQLKGRRDWGEQQVLGSGNHTNEPGLWNTIVSSVWGGMNYQIEHHLFPSVSHVHYPAVSQYVRETCKEFGVPYVTHSWAYALWRFACLIHDMSRSGDRSYTTTQQKKEE
ncbi:heme binding [Balamuthia mandrillaris]